MNATFLEFTAFFDFSLRCFKQSKNASDRFAVGGHVNVSEIFKDFFRLLKRKKKKKGNKLKKFIL